VPIVAVIAEKGGSGKTTTAAFVAAELAARGARALLVDADSQGTALTGAGIGAEAGHVGPRVVALGDNLRAELPRLAAEHDWTIVDCPGRASKRAAAALMVADVALLPCAPSPPDVWALGTTAELVGEVRELQPELRAAVLVVRADRTGIGASAREALGTLGLPVLASSLGDRAAFREALADGRGVTAYAPSSRAAAEVRALVDELEALAGVATTKRAKRRR
jgi:chromosome partitioning protein